MMQRFLWKLYTGAAEKQQSLLLFEHDVFKVTSTLVQTLL
jgi:hypothetical protein